VSSWFRFGIAQLRRSLRFSSMMAALAAFFGGAMAEA
jgi:hypothetical protein